MAEQARGIRRVAVGVVTSDKMNKTRRVEIPRLVKHVRYGKYIRRRTICQFRSSSMLTRSADRTQLIRPRHPLQPYHSGI